MQESKPALKVASHQSVFLPWAGFWHKVASSDVVVIANDTDFSRRDYEHRVTIAGAWATLPLRKEGREISSQVVLSDGGIADRIERELMVKRFKYRDRLAPIVEDLRTITREEVKLSELNWLLLHSIARVLGLETVFLRDDMKTLGPTKTQRLMTRLSRHITQDYTYLAGFGAKAYLDCDFKQPILYQHVADGVSTDSVLQLIAEEEDPLAKIIGVAEWRK